MIDVEKIIYDLRKKVVESHPEYTDKEVSAYVAGMVHGFSLARMEQD